MTTGTESERLYFRPLTEEYKPQLIQFFTTPEAVKFFNPIEDVDAFVDMWLEKTKMRSETQGTSFNALIDKATGAFIGQNGVLVQSLDGEEEIYHEVGYHIMPQYWNKGYATEAAIHSRNYVFNNRPDNLVISIIHEKNEPSKAVARKNGMQVTRKAKFREFPVEVFGITREEWEKIKG